MAEGQEPIISSGEVPEGNTLPNTSPVVESPEEFASKNGFSLEDIKWVAELLKGGLSIDDIIKSQEEVLKTTRRNHWDDLSNPDITNQNDRVLMLKHVRHALIYTGHRQGEEAL